MGEYIQPTDEEIIASAGVDREKIEDWFDDDIEERIKKQKLRKF